MPISDLASLAAYGFSTSLVSDALFTHRMNHAHKLEKAEKYLQPFMQPEEADRFVGFMSRIRKRMKQMAELKQEHSESGLDGLLKYFGFKKGREYPLATVKFYPHTAVLYASDENSLNGIRGLISFPSDDIEDKGDEIDLLFRQVTRIGKLEEAIIVDTKSPVESIYLNTDMYKLVSPIKTVDEPVEKECEQAKYMLACRLAVYLNFLAFIKTENPRRILNHASSLDSELDSFSKKYFEERMGSMLRRLRRSEERLKLFQSNELNEPISNERRIIADVQRVLLEVPSRFSDISESYGSLAQQLILMPACTILTESLEPLAAKSLYAESAIHLRTVGFEQHPFSVSSLQIFSLSDRGMDIYAEMENLINRIV